MVPVQFEPLLAVELGCFPLSHLTQVLVEAVDEVLAKLLYSQLAIAEEPAGTVLVQLAVVVLEELSTTKYLPLEQTANEVVHVLELVFPR